MAINTITALASKRAKKSLEEKGLTQEWLASATGIPMRTLARRLHSVNPSSMSLEELFLIADALEESPANLIAPETEAVAS